MMVLANASGCELQKSQPLRVGISMQTNLPLETLASCRSRIKERETLPEIPESFATMRIRGRSNGKPDLRWATIQWL